MRQQKPPEKSPAWRGRSIYGNAGLAARITHNHFTPWKGNGVGMSRTGDCYMEASCDVRLQALSSGASQSYIFMFGFSADAAPSNSAANRVMIRYSHTINSGIFQGVCANGSGTESTVSLGVTTAATTMYHLRVVLNKQNNEARFFIDGTYRGRITTNLPATSTIVGANVGLLSSDNNGNQRRAYVSKIGTSYIYSN